MLERIDTLDAATLATLAQRLGRERRLFERVFNVLQEAVLVVDADGGITYANVAAHSLLGLREPDGGTAAPTLWRLVPGLRQLLAPPPTHTAAASNPLRVIQASVGNSLRMVPIDEVLYLEAADKYLRVFTAGADYLIRTPLKELLPQLNPADFWQIHRGTVVRVSAIDTVSRNALGKLSLTLRGSQQTLHISRLYAHQFKAM